MGVSDCWVVQINSYRHHSMGTLYRRSAAGMSFSLERTADGGLLVGNTVETIGVDYGDITDTYGELDAWLVKLSSSGTLLWQKCTGWRVNDWLFDAIALPNGNYMVLGQSASRNGNAAGNPGLILCRSCIPHELDIAGRFPGLCERKLERMYC